MTGEGRKGEAIVELDGCNEGEERGQRGWERREEGTGRGRDSLSRHLAATY
jgi:hypothetical protein